MLFGKLTVTRPGIGVARSITEGCVAGVASCASAGLINAVVLMLMTRSAPVSARTAKGRAFIGTSVNSRFAQLRKEAAVIGRWLDSKALRRALGVSHTPRMWGASRLA